MRKGHMGLVRHVLQPDIEGAMQVPGVVVKAFDGNYRPTTSSVQCHWQVTTLDLGRL